MSTETEYAKVRPTRRISVTVLGLALLTGFTLAACGSHGSPRSSSATSSPATSTPATSAPVTSSPTIVIDNFAFKPSTLTVEPGATVTVKNEDPTIHTLTEVAPNQGGFNTGDIQPGSTVTFTAPRTPDTYAYICEIHQFMTGVLKVS